MKSFLHMYYQVKGKNSKGIFDQRCPDLFGCLDVFQIVSSVNYRPSNYQNWDKRSLLYIEYIVKKYSLTIQDGFQNQRWPPRYSFFYRLSLPYIISNKVNNIEVIIVSSLSLNA